MRIFIIGGGREVYFLTKAFISKGHQLTIINQDEEFCRKISRNFKVTVVVGDGSKPFMLGEADIEYADLVIALTENDPDNLVICQIANKIYGIAKTFAIVNDPENIKTFKSLGVETVVSNTTLISNMIEQRAVIDDIQNMTEIGDGKVAYMEVDVAADHPVVDKMLKDIDFPTDAIICCIIRGEEAIIPKGSTSIKENDRLLIMSKPELQSDVLKHIRGKVD